MCRLLVLRPELETVGETMIVGGRNGLKPEVNVLVYVGTPKLPQRNTRQLGRQEV